MRSINEKNMVNTEMKGMFMVFLCKQTLARKIIDILKTICSIFKSLCHLCESLHAILLFPNPCGLAVYMNYFEKCTYCFANVKMHLRLSIKTEETCIVFNFYKLEMFNSALLCFSC